jgi:hypothetical protein
MALTMSSIVAKSTNFVDSDFDDDIVLMSLKNSEYYAMQGSAREVWTLLDEPQSVAVLGDRLSALFDGPRQTIRAETLVFLQELLKEKLIEAKDGPSEADA